VPMYYIRAGLPGPVGAVLSGAFAVFCILGTVGAGPLFQTKAAYEQLVIVTGGADASPFAGAAWAFGLLMAAATGAVIIGGIRSIAAVSERIVPFMGLLYIGGGLAVIALHAPALPEALATIAREALTPAAGLGGFLGALLTGVQRAAFSNEAGLGSAAIAHAAVKTDCPVSQGLVGMLGPFIDTVVICMITALVIVVTGVADGGQGMEGVALTSRAFEAAAWWAPYGLFVVVILFAYSTMIAWSYYGLKAFTYLFGQGPVREAGFKVAYCACIVVGASAQLGHVIAFTDAAVFAMAIPNIIGLYALAPALRRDLRAYLASARA
jgi:alanine or glycine:cation symporter, AGCS family